MFHWNSIGAPKSVYERAGKRYLFIRAQRADKSLPKSLGGMSGSGLWEVPVGGRKDQGAEHLQVSQIGTPILRGIVSGKRNLTTKMTYWVSMRTNWKRLQTTSSHGWTVKLGWRRSTPVNDPATRPSQLVLAEPTLNGCGHHIAQCNASRRSTPARRGPTLDTASAPPTRPRATPRCRACAACKACSAGSGCSLPGRDPNGSDAAVFASAAALETSSPRPFRNDEAPEMLEAVQQPVGVGGIAARGCAAGERRDTGARSGQAVRSGSPGGEPRDADSSGRRRRGTVRRQVTERGGASAGGGGGSRRGCGTEAAAVDRQSAATAGESERPPTAAARPKPLATREDARRAPAGGVGLRSSARRRPPERAPGRSASRPTRPRRCCRGTMSSAGKPRCGGTRSPAARRQVNIGGLTRPELPATSSAETPCSGRRRPSGICWKELSRIETPYIGRNAHRRLVALSLVCGTTIGRRPGRKPLGDASFDPAFRVDRWCPMKSTTAGGTDLARSPRLRRCQGRALLR